MDIDVSELNELAVDLGKATVGVVAKAALVIQKTAYNVERDAKAFCPVDTGNLRSTISTSVRGLTAEIGPTAEYGAFVEYGTSTMAPHAYMGPAADRNFPTMETALGKVLGDLL